MIDIKSHKVTKCQIGGHGNLDEIWRLPRFPLTEMFGPFDPNFPSFDQSLLIDTESGHVQLENQLSPEFLYSAADYSYRSAQSSKGLRDEVTFLEFLEPFFDDGFGTVVELGGNDLSFARKLLSRSTGVTVIDPVCEQIDGTSVDGINVLGRFVENVDIRKEIGKVNLIVARHTLEHVASPLALLEQLFTQCPDECLFVFEVPSLSSMCESYRFDAVFHQHYHYFDVDSFKYLIAKAGGSYVSHVDNYQGSCGGSLLIAFRSHKDIDQGSSGTIDAIKRKKEILARIEVFERQMELTLAMIENCDGPLYGYGAGLLLATFGYHLKTDFAHFVSILDDDKSKHGSSYRNVDVKISHPELVKVPEQSNYLITSLESVRPIAKRVLDFTPKRIFVPGVY